jgi:hypothetical protein
MTINKPQAEEKFGTNFSKMPGKKQEGLLSTISPASVKARSPSHP